MSATSESARGRITDPVAARRLMCAGNATLTVVSLRTGARFTYRVRQPEDTAPRFVSVLTGSDNERDYTFIGTIFGDNTGRAEDYRHGRRSKVSPNAPSAEAFAWLWRALDRPELPSTVELWHEGRCCRCGRKLTTPESVAAGLGPECAGRVS